MLRSIHRAIQRVVSDYSNRLIELRSRYSTFLLYYCKYYYKELLVTYNLTTLISDFDISDYIQIIIPYIGKRSKIGQRPTGIICMRVRVNISDLFIYRYVFCPAYTKLIFSIYPTLTVCNKKHRGMAVGRATALGSSIW
jgi:hypothetical protein